MAAAIILRLSRTPATHADFESLQMPEFDQHQRRQGHSRHAGLRSFLSNIHAPLDARLRAPDQAFRPVLQVGHRSPITRIRAETFRIDARQSLRYCEWVLVEHSHNAQLCLRRGRLLHEQKRTDEAALAYARARELGLPASRVLPYQAELCFEHKDFLQARALLQELGQWSALPRLHPVVDYWSGR